MAGMKTTTSFSKAVVVRTDNSPATQKAPQPGKPKISFLDLPFEIREIIYNELGLPDLSRYYNYLARGQSQNAVGFTNILLSNRQMYYETIAYFRKMPNTVHLSGSGRMVFRDPFATGKPSFFHSDAAISKTFVPDCLSELEFINLEIVTLKIQQQTSHWEIVEVLEAIKKSRTLKHIQLNCQVCRATQTRRGKPHITTDWALVKYLKDSIRHLVRHCINHNIKLTAAPDCSFESNQRERRAGRGVYAPHYIDPLAKKINEFHPLQISNDTITEAEKHPITRAQPTSFTLTPECHWCHALFSNFHQLHTHYKHNPRHKIPFRKRKYNWIHPLATSGGGRHTCLVCARSYASRDNLDAHIQKARHQRDRERQGVVGRWVEDNEWFTCLDSEGGSGGEGYHSYQDKRKDWYGEDCDRGWKQGDGYEGEGDKRTSFGDGYGQGAW